VVLGLGAKVLEDALLPVTLHQVPVFYLSLADGVGDRVGVLQAIKKKNSTESKIEHTPTKLCCLQKDYSRTWLAMASSPM